MKCSKISHRVILSSLFALFALPFLFSSGHAYASSANITPVINSVQSIDVSNLGFTPNYLVFDLDYSAANTFQKINANYQVGSNQFGNPFNANFADSFCSYYIRQGNMMTQLVCQFDSSKSPVYRINPIFPDQFAVGITMTLYDFLPGDPCPDCPEVPEETEVLLDIKRSILFIPAMLFVIYLFYILYSFYIGGSR